MAKILGGTDPVTSELFQVTRGIGQGENGLSSVDAATSGGQVTVKNELVMIASSDVNQEPAGLDTSLQLTFGPPQALPQFNLDAAGNFTCLEADQYNFTLRLQMGRIGSGGEAILFGRSLLNGVQQGATIYTLIDDSDDNNPLTFVGSLPMEVNDVLTFELYRDSAGTNAGGVYTQTANLAGWTDAPSARLIVERPIAIQS